jgi:hypothetical protein
MGCLVNNVLGEMWKVETVISRVACSRISMEQVNKTKKTYHSSPCPNQNMEWTHAKYTGWLTFFSLYVVNNTTIISQLQNSGENKILYFYYLCFIL